MKTLDVRRHSFRKQGGGSQLSQAGVEYARQLGASMGSFAYVALQRLNYCGASHGVTTEGSPVFQDRGLRTSAFATNRDRGIEIEGFNPHLPTGIEIEG